MKRTFVLLDSARRQRAKQAIDEAPEGYRCAIDEPKRTSAQNDHFHALCEDVARSDVQWMGKRRTKAEWKTLLVSGHAVVTQEGADVIPGLEGEFVNIRESTALMSVKRSASLIEYTLAFCAANAVKIRQPE